MALRFLFLTHLLLPVTLGSESTAQGPWVGATPVRSSAEVSVDAAEDRAHLRCEFTVPTRALTRAGEVEESRRCPRASCHMDHIWPKGVLGQFVLRLLKGSCLPTRTEDDGSGEEAPKILADGWYVQPEYSWKTPTGSLQGWGGSPFLVQPGHKVLAQVLPGVDVDDVHSYYVQTSSAGSSEPVVLSVITPFAGTREDCSNPSGAVDSHHLRSLDFKLAGTHQLWCMFTPLDGEKNGALPHLDEDGHNTCADHLAQGRMGCEKDLLITAVQPPLESVRKQSPTLVLS